MEALYICLLFLFSSGLGVPITDWRHVRNTTKALTQKGRYGICGETQAEIEKYPYTASITYVPDKSLLGGAAILNKYWLVCSGYQINDNRPEDLSVRVGSNDVSKGGQQLNVSKTIVHEKFRRNYPYDLALVKTTDPIKLNKKAKPIKLATETPKAGTQAEITGFGETSPFTASGKLQVGTMEVRTQDECQTAHRACDETCICADADEVQPCYGDIGDPFVTNKQLVGWFVGGDYCGVFFTLEVYCNAALLRQWILDKIKQNSNEEEMEGIDDDDFYRSFDEDHENEKSNIYNVYH